METLNCPNCGGLLRPDNSGLTGICAYCGSVVQLAQLVEVRHTGLLDWKAKLDAAKTLYRLGEIQRSDELLQQLSCQYPQNPEIWLLMSLVHAPIPEQQIQQNPEWYRNVDIRSALLTQFSQGKEIQYARSLLSEDQGGLYNDYLKQYVDRLDAEFALVQTARSRSLPINFLWSPCLLLRKKPS